MNKKAQKKLKELLTKGLGRSPFPAEWRQAKKAYTKKQDPLVVLGVKAEPESSGDTSR